MKYFLSVLLCILLALICVVRVNAAPPAQDQRHLTIYQIMVASFIHDPAGAPGYTSMWGPDGHTKNGNLKGIGTLVEGLPAQEVIDRLSGITCGFKNTSCPDQLACALKEALI